MSFLPYGRKSSGGWLGAYGTSVGLHAAFVLGLIALRGFALTLPEAEAPPIDFTVTLERLDADTLAGIIEREGAAGAEGNDADAALPDTPDEGEDETELAALVPETPEPTEPETPPDVADETPAEDTPAETPEALPAEDLAALEPENVEANDAQSLEAAEPDVVAPESLPEEPVAPEPVQAERIAPEAVAPEAIDPLVVPVTTDTPDLSPILPETVAAVPLRPTALPLAPEAAGPESLRPVGIAPAAPTPAALAPIEEGPQVVTAISRPITPTPAPGADGDQPAPRPAAAPPAPPSAQDLALGDLIRRIRAQEADACLTSLPRRDGEDGVGLAIVAARDGAMEDFARALLNDQDADIRQTRTLIDERQCAALAFMRANGDYPATRMGIRVDTPEVASGGRLTGVLRGAAGRHLTLLLIDDNGVVQDLQRFLAFSGNFVRFDVPVTRSGPARDTSQILLAIATRRAPTALRARNGQLADEVFEGLIDELAADAHLATATFDVR